MHRSPIAIIGRGCVLPEALDVAEFESLLFSGRIALSEASAQSWSVNLGDVMASPEQSGFDKTWTTMGGHVHGFEKKFDPDGLLLPEEKLGDDALNRWMIYAGRQALYEAGFDDFHKLPSTGVVMGNLSYPTPAHNHLGLLHWLNLQADNLHNEQLVNELRALNPNYSNRFSTGLPVITMARALGCKAGSMALDAACASSLYAIKLACDRLNRGEVDLMLAGAANHADDLFIHIGFSALGALSRSGKSFPLQKQADGLLPAEGSVVFALCRLDDAIKHKRPILGLIRGIGLSNDGSQGGFLHPSSNGQVRSMELAYRQAQIDPAAISFVECHATGTVVGDNVEIQSLKQVYKNNKRLTVGALKANFGHSITVAGGAGLLKVLAGMHGKTLPPTPIQGVLLDDLGDGEGVLRVSNKPEPWESDEPLRAGINAFGFGGNNAHAIIEQWCGPQNVSVAMPKPVAKKKAGSKKKRYKPLGDNESEKIAIVRVAVQAGKAKHAGEFIHRLFTKTGETDKADNGESDFSLDALQLDLSKVKTPPNDLKQTLTQQLLVLLTTLQACEDLEYKADSTSIFVGMGCDSEISRHNGRWRLKSFLQSLLNEEIDPHWLARAQDAFMKPCDAARVIGAMPNISANRISQLLDLRAPSFTIGAEENSGLAALEVAIRALHNREIDTALVAAVDASCESLHRQAVKTLLPENRHVAGDAAVVLALRRYADACEHEDEIYAVIEPDKPQHPVAVEFKLNKTDPGLAQRFGHAHAASGLLQVAAAAVAVKHAAKPQSQQPALPWYCSADQARNAKVEVEDLGGETRAYYLTGRAGAHGIDTEGFNIYYYAAKSRDLLAKRIKRGARGGHGDVRLAIVCDAKQKQRMHRDAIDAVLNDIKMPGVFFRERAVKGDIAVVFNGVAATYSGVARELSLAVPEIGHRLQRRTSSINAYPRCLQPGHNALSLTPMEQIFSSILFGQLHTEWTLGIAGIKPDAAIGISAGETNCLYALGVWRGLDETLQQLESSEIYKNALSNEFHVVRDAWRCSGALAEDEAVEFGSWRLLHPVEEILQVIESESPLVRITIIHSDNDFILSGQKQACEAFIKRVNANALPMGIGLSIHTPDIAAYADAWYELHKKPTKRVEGIRFYTNATNNTYKPTSVNAAKMSTKQAVSPVDLRQTVKQAYTDGVRVFIEHGPRNLCSQWIDDILKNTLSQDQQGDDRDYLSIAMDVPGKNSFKQALEVVAQLWVAQVPLDMDAVVNAVPEPLDKTRDQEQSQKTFITIAAHPPDVVLPPLLLQTQAIQDVGRKMPRAPAIASTSEAWNATESECLNGSVHSGLTGSTINTGPPEESREETRQHTTQPLAREELLARQLTEVHQGYLNTMSAAMENMKKSIQQFHRSVYGNDANNAIAGLPTEDISISKHDMPATTSPSAELRSTPVADHVPNTISQTGKASPPQIAETEKLPGPKWGRKALETLAGGKISSIFGQLFEQQDHYRRQVRMPMPPLLLADRVTGIDAEAGSMGKGTIWTETDIGWDSWYLHHGHIPAGIMVEAGQADLLLISYLGADFLNQDKRVYRLLGCELTYHGPLGKAGETLKFDIHIDGHAQHGDVRLFFFHYDCHVNKSLRMSVRNGQAGFFSDEELAQSDGVIWNPDEIEYDTADPLDQPLVALAKDKLTNAELSRFAQGDLVACFGDAFSRGAAHTRTPAIPRGDMLLLNRVTKLSHSTGPCARGYLRAELDLLPEHWFYKGHFKNDPCMPGTLMAEGCLQAMAVYLTSLGYTLEKDGWRFEPVPEKTFYLSCRGQAAPNNKLLVYEFFVTSVSQHPYPTVVGDVLCTVDGLKAFHGKGMALRLVPGWPLEDKPLPPLQPEDCYAAVSGDIKGDSQAISACALGRPSAAFGALYSFFDTSGLTVPRLPGPPYLFISRMHKIPPQAGTMRAGDQVEAQFDISPEAWFFHDNGAQVMPFCVLLEAVLQPCGWLASFCIAGSTQQELAFRNLDGTGTVYGEILPQGGPLTTSVTHTRLSKSGGMIIVSFDVQCRQEQRLIYSLNTVFGFFSPEALRNQVGLEANPLMSDILRQAANLDIDLREKPSRYFANSCALATGKLLMIDIINGCWPGGGSKKLGAVRASKYVRPGEWFFKAHFFQDPVQPGSLGLEAMLQVLQFYMLHSGMDKDIPNARFEAVGLEKEMTWKYRGQVVPENRLIEITLDITDKGLIRDGAYAVADASLWVDGLRIYHASDLAMRIVPGKKKLPYVYK